MESGSNVQSNRRASRVTVSEVALRSVYPGMLTVAGGATGREYVWYRGGAEVKVDERDAVLLLERKYGGCCGGTRYKMFELVKEKL